MFKLQNLKLHGKAVSNVGEKTMVNVVRDMNRVLGVQTGSKPGPAWEQSESFLETATKWYIKSKKVRGGNE